MQGLLQDLLQEIDQADQTLQLIPSLSQPTPPPVPQPELPQVKKPLKQEPQFSFGKQKRFADDKEQTQSLDDSFMSTASTCTSASLRSTASLGFQFGKKERFSKEQSQPQSMLTPNYDVTRAQPRGFLIPKTKAASKIENDYIGPGTYSLNYKQVEGQSQVAMDKETRFKKEQSLDQQLLQLNYKQIDKRVNGVVIKNKLIKNEKLIKKQQLEVVAEEGRARRERERHVDKYKQIDRHVGSIKMDKFQFFNWQHELRKQRQAGRQSKLGPGCYQWDRPQKAVCLVVYRSCSPVVRRLQERRPSPTRYFAGEEGQSTRAQAYTFAKEPREKEQQADRRKALDVQYHQIDKDIPQVHMSGGGRAEQEVTLEELKRGPGKYEPDYTLVLPRTNMALRLTPGDRQQEIEDQMINKDIYQGYLNINWTTQNKNQLVFAYHQDTEWGPTYIPQSALYPEKWKYYDHPQEQGHAALIANGKTREAFLDYQQDYQGLIEYLARKRRTPEQYDINYTQIDKHVPVVEIREQIENQVIIQEQDELILEPGYRNGPTHLANIQWHKQPARWSISPDKEPQVDNRMSPKQQNNKIKGMVEMDKQIRDIATIKDQPVEPIGNIDYAQVDAKIKGQVRMDKQVVPQQKQQQDYEVQLNIEPLPKKIKQNVNMGKGPPRFRHASKQDALPPGIQNTSMRIQMDKTKQAVLPKTQSSLWTKNTGRNDRQALNQQIQAKIAHRQASQKKKDKLEQLEKRRKRGHDRIAQEQLKTQPVDEQSIVGWQHDDQQ